MYEILDRTYTYIHIHIHLYHLYLLCVSVGSKPEGIETSAKYGLEALNRIMKQVVLCRWRETHAPLKTGTPDKPFYGSLFPANRDPPLSSPSSSFKRAREGDRGWKFLKEKVIRSRSKDSLDWFSSPEKSMRREEEEEEEKESVFSFPYVEQEWFKSDSDCNEVEYRVELYLFVFFFNPRTTFWNYTLKGGGKKKKRGKKNLGIGSRRSFHSRLYHLSFQFAFVTILIPFSVRV